MSFSPTSHLIYFFLNKTSSFILKCNPGSLLGKCFSFSFPAFSFLCPSFSFAVGSRRLGGLFSGLGTREGSRAAVSKEGRGTVLGGEFKNPALRKYYIKGGLLPGIATPRQFTFFFSWGEGGECY